MLLRANGKKNKKSLVNREKKITFASDIKTRLLHEATED